jgi:hypothetical protein
VAGELLLAPGGGEALHQVGRGDQLGAGAAQQLGGAGVEARHRRDGRLRAVLGGDPPPAAGRVAARAAGDQAGHLFGVLAPGQVGPLLPRQVVEHRRLQPVDELGRRALARHQVVAAPRQQAVAAEAEEVEADRVVGLEQREQPAVEVGLGQRLLDGGDTVGEHRRSPVGQWSPRQVRGHEASRARAE